MTQISDPPTPKEALMDGQPNNQTHYIVRNVMLTPDGAAAVTLDPIIWFRDDSDPASDELHDSSPDDPAANAMRIGGRTTELRFEDDPSYRPGDFVRVDVTLVNRAGERNVE